MRRRIIAFLAIAVLGGGTAPALARAAGPSSGAPSVAGGWGTATSSYIGKYAIEPGPGRATASASTVAPAAGLFSQAVISADRLAAAAGPVSSGALDTFLRKVKTGEPLSPSGILTLYGPSGTQILYLTDMALHGTQRVATVNGGSFLGDPIGSFVGSIHGGVFNAVITASGLGTAHVRLVNFAPTPPSS